MLRCISSCVHSIVIIEMNMALIQKAGSHPNSYAAVKLIMFKINDRYETNDCNNM